MNVDRAVRRLFVASDKGCTIPYSAEETKKAKEYLMLADLMEFRFSDNS